MHKRESPQQYHMRPSHASMQVTTHDKIASISSYLYLYPTNLAQDMLPLCLPRKIVLSNHTPHAQFDGPHSSKELKKNRDTTSVPTRRTSQRLALQVMPKKRKKQLKAPNYVCRGIKEANSPQMDADSACESKDFLGAALRAAAWCVVHLSVIGRERKDDKDEKAA